MNIKRLDHLVITTNKPEKCVEFYSALGFIPKTSDNRIELFTDNFKINVHLFGKELLPHAANAIPGSADLCFEIHGNLDDVVDQLKTKGILLEMEKSSRSGTFGKIHSIYLRDPDGNLVELSQYPE